LILSNYSIEFYDYKEKTLIKMKKSFGSLWIKQENFKLYIYLHFEFLLALDNKEKNSNKRLEFESLHQENSLFIFS